MVLVLKTPHTSTCSSVTATFTNHDVQDGSVGHCFYTAHSQGNACHNKQCPTLVETSHCSASYTLTGISTMTNLRRQVPNSDGWRWCTHSWIHCNDNRQHLSVHYIPATVTSAIQTFYMSKRSLDLLLHCKNKQKLDDVFRQELGQHKPDPYKTLSCRRESAQCCVSLNISQSLKVIRNDTIEYGINPY